MATKVLVGGLKKTKSSKNIQPLFVCLVFRLFGGDIYTVRNEGSFCLMTAERILEHIFPLGPGKCIFNRGTKSLKLC